MENLIRGKHDVLPNDIHFTLKQFPNHYGVLISMSKWLRENPRPPYAAYFPADCYFKRALAFTPDNPNIYLI